MRQQPPRWRQSATPRERRRERRAGDAAGAAGLAAGAGGLAAAVGFGAVVAAVVGTGACDWHAARSCTEASPAAAFKNPRLLTAGSRGDRLVNGHNLQCCDSTHGHAGDRGKQAKKHASHGRTIKIAVLREYGEA